MGFLYSQLFVTPKTPQANLNGQTIIITGANVGLGFEAAKHLARLNASKIIIACRSVEKGETAALQIRQSSSPSNKTDIEAWPLDLSSYRSIQSFAERAEALPRLDAVIHNAGILTERWELMEGNESNVHVNAIAPVFLSLLLLPKMRESAIKNKRDGRIAFVGSETALWTKFKEGQLQGKLLENLNEKAKAKMGGRYPVSKLLQLMLSRQLSAASPLTSQSPVIITALTPGFCKSTVFRDQGFSAKMMKGMQNILGRTTEVGSRTLVDGICGHGREVHGGFLWDQKLFEPTGIIATSKGGELESKIRKETMELLEGVRPGITRNL